MDISNYENFIVIAEEGNLSSAAKRLFVSPSTLSKQLQAMEQEFGVRLLKRSQGQLVLTYAGELFLESARRITSEARSFTHALGDISTESRGVLNLGISSPRIDLDFQYILPDYLKAYPNYMLNITTGSGMELNEALLEGKIDLAFTSFKERYPQLVHERILLEEMLLVVSKKNPLARHAGYEADGSRRKCDPGWLRDTLFLIRDANSHNYDVFLRFKKGLSYEPRLGINNCDTMLLLELTSKTDCCSFCSEAYLRHFDDLVGFSLPEPQYQDYCCLYRSGYRLNTQEKYLIDLVKRYYSVPG